MSSLLTSTPDNIITLDDVYSAILAKERDYATQLYSQLNGITLTHAKQAMSIIYRVFHLGYEDCLHSLSINDMPGFENSMYLDVWRAGFSYALKLSIYKENFLPFRLNEHSRRYCGYSY